MCVSLAASKPCTLRTFLIKADWAFGQEGGAKHFLKDFLLQFHCEKIHLKDDAGIRIETNMSLVGQFYFESLRNTGSQSDDPRWFNTEVSPSRKYKGFKTTVNLLTSFYFRNALELFSSIILECELKQSYPG